MIIENKLLGREFVKRPACPFCKSLVERPKELDTRWPGEMPVGICSCGAVYACDVTGHNIGSAIVEALVFGCNMDWDLAWSLLPEEDYRQEIVEQYDAFTHLIVPGGFLEGRRVSGVLLFIRPHPDVLEVTAEGVRKRLRKAIPVYTHGGHEVLNSKKTALSKKQVEDLVGSYEVKPILDAVGGHDKRLIQSLQRLLYSGDPQLRHRAADILGQVSATISERDPAPISKLLQRLFYAITDTAASTWGAFEAIGEIIGYRPDLFAGYIPHLYQFLADESRRALALETLATITKSRPDLLRKATYLFIRYLADPSPNVRGYAALLMGNLGAHEIREDLESLREDPHEIPVYEQGHMLNKTVGEIASEALERL